MASLRIPVLTYHSHHIGESYATSDRIALASDLRTIAAMGMRVVPLLWVAEWAFGRRPDSDVRRGVAITFDDGADFDYLDLPHPVHGLQPSMARILREFAEEIGATQPLVEATSFVIASPAVRERLDRRGLHGKDWVSDGWWKDAQESGWLSIQSHSWDHNHPVSETVCQRDQRKGSFANIETLEECECEVAGAGRFISQKLAGRWPVLFAYPYGESSPYLREVYFPRYAERHRTLAAFGASGGYVTADSNRWNLERFVCANQVIGWQTPEQLEALLAGAA